MVDSTDHRLVIRSINGSPQAFGKLVQRYQKSIFNVCYRLTHNRREAEDLTQDAFIRAYQRLYTFDPDREFGPWMRRVAANVCYNYLEKINRRKENPLDDEKSLSVNGKNDNPEKAVEAVEKSEAIRRAIAQLPPHFRLVLELRHFQELTYDEMSAELELPLNTVKSHLFRARKRLAEMITEVDNFEN